MVDSQVPGVVSPSPATARALVLPLQVALAVAGFRISVPRNIIATENPLLGIWILNLLQGGWMTRKGREPWRAESFRQENTILPSPSGLWALELSREKPFLWVPACTTPFVPLVSSLTYLLFLTSACWNTLPFCHLPSPSCLILGFPRLFSSFLFLSPLNLFGSFPIISSLLPFKILSIYLIFPFLLLVDSSFFSFFKKISLNRMTFLIGPGQGFLRM